MSSCEPRSTIARSPAAVARATVLALAVAVAGCSGGEGLRPMYAPNSAGVGLQDRLAAVDVATIPSRVGQRIRNELLFQHTGGGHRAPPEYRLQITITESLGSTLVRSSGEAASQVYNLDANFKLVRLGDGKIVAQGNSHARAEFERFQQIYANVRARDDAENRAARAISDDLKVRLAAVLSREQG